eukprot:scaffold7671_cov417-Prasinococcus_capsulatus_cf.AAC.8
MSRNSTIHACSAGFFARLCVPEGLENVGITQSEVESSFAIEFHLHSGQRDGACRCCHWLVLLRNVINNHCFGAARANCSSITRCLRLDVYDAMRQGINGGWINVQYTVGASARIPTWSRLRTKEPRTG